MTELGPRALPPSQRAASKFRSFVPRLSHPTRKCRLLPELSARGTTDERIQSGIGSGELICLVEFESFEAREAAGAAFDSDQPSHAVVRTSASSGPLVHDIENRMSRATGFSPRDDDTDSPSRHERRFVFGASGLASTPSFAGSLARGRRR